jgi:starvation-inducible DNA-binding protein
MFDKPKQGNGGAARPQDIRPGAGALEGEAEPKSTMKAARTIIQSRIDLPAEERSKLAGVLQVSLATSFDLFSQIKQAHWNVIGPHFIAYHELFDEIAGHALDWIDHLAERSAALGGVPQGTVRQSATLSQLPDYALGAAEGPSHVEALSERFAIYCAKLREAADTLERDADIHDLATQDLLIEILRAAEQDLWFLDKHTQRAR